MKALDLWYGRLLGLVGIGVGLAFAALTLVISADVVGRNFGVANFAWSTEVSEYLLYASSFLGAPWLLRLGGHIRMDLVCQFLPQPVRTALETLCDLLGFTVSGVMFWYGSVATGDAFRSGTLTIKLLVLPEWWILAVVPVSAALLMVEFAFRLARVFQPAEGGRP